ncbi:DgyrCDS13885 [Dimorphilus gyrociliatus]|uniref:DgyrCDS13885 n=1 Tax=Dimorphilus gyrociliatus TaxID=2664684 RepID=A0A7I8WBZ2_9ANNE|nr:DgyrCDS13885 [Dimorphilus gyrociliatus]
MQRHIIALSEFSSRRPPFYDYEKERENCVYKKFDSSKHSPVFYGKLHARVDGDFCLEDEFDASVSHPATIGVSLVDEPTPPPPPAPKSPPPKENCTARDYCQYYILPILIPGMEKMLEQAKEEKCFERKRTKFNALDFLTHYLYTHNKLYTDREGVSFEEIPFVKEHWKTNPRPPLPLSLIWNESEASLIIQSWFRGYKIRCEEKVSELRHWQKEWREDNEAAIKAKVQNFWQERGQSDDDEVESVGLSKPSTRPNTGTKSVHPTAYDRMHDPTKPRPVLSAKKDKEKKSNEVTEEVKEEPEVEEKEVEEVEKVEVVLPEVPKETSPKAKKKSVGRRTPEKVKH